MSSSLSAVLRSRPIREVRGWPLTLAELSLVLLNLSAVLGLRRLFEDWEFLTPALIALFGAHLTAVVLRRLRLGSIVSVLTSMVVMVFVTTNARYGETTNFIVPTADTWSAVGDDIALAWDEFAVVKAPAPALAGFLFSLMVVLWLVATLSDLAAFRVRTVLEAVLPATTLVVFNALLGVEQWRVSTTAFFVAAACLFLLASRIAFPLSSAVPVGRSASRQPAAQLRSGLLVAGAALSVGVLAGPLLPGVDGEPVIDWKALDGGGGGRVTLSPLVDARGRLVEQSDIELFRVRTDDDTGAYWRTTALDSYSNGVWGSSYRYRAAEGALGSPDSASGVIVEAEVTIGALGDIWLPAPYEAVEIDGIDANWDAELSSLITDGDRTAEGQTYQIRSVVPTYTPERLRLASGVIPDDIRLRYTALPVDTSPRVTELGRELTDGLRTNYDRALALQDFFRQNFTYSTDVSTGHSNDRLERFLFEDRIGYCEQFAGTYAVMARAVGLPTRVAIGFTPGDRVGDEFIVRGTYYHAWPEVWIGGAWVPFEPTPGRGSPQGVAWTGVQPAQEGGFADPNAAEEENLDGGALAIPSTSFDLEQDLLDLNADDTDTAAVAADDGSSGPFLRILLVLAVIGGLGAAWWFGLPALVESRRRRRHHRAVAARGKGLEIWRDIVQALTAHGRAPLETETRREYAERVGSEGWVPGPAMTSAARQADAAQFGLEPPTDAELDELRHHRNVIVERLDARGEWADRARRRLDPRALVR